MPKKSITAKHPIKKILQLAVVNGDIATFSDNTSIALKDAKDVKGWPKNRQFK